MTKSHGESGNIVSIPVAELDTLARQTDAAADDIEASRRRLEADTANIALNDNDPAFTPARFRSRLLTSAAGLRRTAAQLRATAGLAADTSALARAADADGGGPALADAPVADVESVVDRLSAHTTGDNVDTADPGWRTAWRAATTDNGPDNNDTASFRQRR